MAVINLSRLHDVVQEISDDDGHRRRHQEHSISIKKRRCCNERFDARIAPIAEVDEDELLPNSVWDEENARIIDELKEMYFGVSYEPDGVIDLTEDHPCELHSSITLCDDLQKHEALFVDVNEPLPGF